MHAMETLLSNKEIERQCRYRKSRDRKHYLIRTAILRELLGIILEKDASSLRFFKNENGKPFLEKPTKIEFNVSHSNGLTLMAFHPNCKVGIDVERINKELNWKPIADRWFPAKIKRELLSIPTEQRNEKFFELWCRFEAILKCSGQGIKGLNPSNPELVDAKEAIWNLDVPAGYKAIVAMEKDHC